MSLKDEQFVKEIIEENKNFLPARAFTIRYIEKDDAIAIYDNLSFLITPNEAKILVSGLQNFINQYPQEEIEKYNAEKLEKMTEATMYSPYISQKKKGIPGVVYLLKRSDGLIKIGYSTQFKKRINSLQREHGSLETLKTFESENVELLEALMHQRFQSKRVSGEWFRLSQEDIEKAEQYYKEVDVS